MDSVSDVSYTGRQVIEEAETVGAHLLAMGLGPRDVMAFYGGNSSEYMIMLLAAFRIGATVALLNAMAVAGMKNIWIHEQHQQVSAWGTILA